MNTDIFTLAWSFAFICFFLGIAEFIGMQLFISSIYSVGIKLYSQVSDIPQPIEINNEKIIMEEGKFKFVSNNECLFTSRIFFFKFFRLSTPFPFKGRVVWSGSRATITGRIPLGTTLFFLSCIAGWTACAFYCKTATYFLIGLLFWGALLGISLPTEKKRMEQMVDELKLIFTTNASSSND